MVRSIIFSRFPESSTAHIPLHMLYFYGIPPEESYYISTKDLDLNNGYWKDIKLKEETIKLFKRQINRISYSQIIFHYSTDKLVINLQTGKQISWNQIYYIQRVVRKEIDPNWSFREIAKNSASYIGGERL